MKKYTLNILVGIDQLANAILGGDPDETISSRCGKSHPRIAAVIDLLFGKGHCQSHMEMDEGKDGLTK